MPSIALAWADGADAGKLVAFARNRLHIGLEIVKKPEDQRGFEVLPRWWVVERTLSWISRYRRPSKDYERVTAHAETMVKWALIGLMARRLAPAPGRRPWQPGTAKSALSQHVLRLGLVLGSRAVAEDLDKDPLEVLEDPRYN